MPQRSNRQNLIDGALRCLERLPPERVTARAIAEEADANLASIGYHFGSKEELVSEAAVAGLDRWLEEFERGLADLPGDAPAARLATAVAELEESRRRHAGLVRNYIAALARSQHDRRVRRVLADGFRRARPNVAAVLGLGGDRAGEDAGALVLAIFHGLLIQASLDPELALGGEQLDASFARLAGALPAPTLPA